MPEYLVAAVKELERALYSTPFIDVSLSVRMQDGKPVFVEITTIAKHKPNELVAGNTGAFDAAKR